MIPYRVRDWWWKARDFFSPRQRWLTKKIPNHWVDKDTLWEICILEGIKHHVDHDAGLRGYETSQTDPEYPEHQKVFDRETKEMYDNVVHYLPALEYRAKEAWDALPKRDLLTSINLNQYWSKGDYETMYGEIDRLEAEVAALKTKIMVWAVTNRASIWT
jgi:hypothetical protein